MGEVKLKKNPQILRLNLLAYLHLQTKRKWNTVVSQVLHLSQPVTKEILRGSEAALIETDIRPKDFCKRDIKIIEIYRSNYGRIFHPTHSLEKHVFLGLTIGINNWILLGSMQHDCRHVTQSSKIHPELTAHSSSS